MLNVPHTRALGPSGGKKCATLLYEYDVFFIVTISAQSYFSHSLRSFELEHIVKPNEYRDTVTLVRFFRLFLSFCVTKISIVC